MSRLTVPFLVVLLAAPALAQVATVMTPAEADAAFRAANDACLKEDYKAGIAGYERLLAAGYGGPDLEFNLGTAYLKQERLGWAVLHLERALRQDPGDPDARANLEAARRRRIDKLVGAPEETGGEEPLSSRLVLFTTGDRWALAFCVLWLLGTAALALRPLWKNRRGTLAAVAALALVAALPAGAVTAVHAYVNERAHDAIIVLPAVPVREGPQASLKPTFEVHEGLKVRVVDQEGGFCRIRLANGLQGWVAAEGVVEISGR